jgi:hypothetical protein
MKLNFYFCSYQGLMGNPFGMMGATPLMIPASFGQVNKT